MAYTHPRTGYRKARSHYGPGEPLKCLACRESKPREQMVRDNRSALGVRSLCKTCDVARKARA